VTDRIPWRQARLEVISDGFHFLEGPRWRDGLLYLSDFYGHRVLTVSPSGQVATVCEVATQPSGLGWTPDGDLLIVSMLDTRLLRLGADGLATVADLSPWAGGVTNDMIVDRRGRAYVGNVGDRSGGTVAPTVLVRVDPDGSVQVVADGLYAPNGAVLTPGQTPGQATLIIAETEANRLTAFDVADDGGLHGRRVWAELGRDGPGGKPVEPDGLALDRDGAIWVADANGHGILRVAAGGQVLDAIDTGELSVYAAALGGADGRTLYLCAAPPGHAFDPGRRPLGVLLSVPVDVPADVPAAGPGS
jgi:sugar lactone lactonase YvrE